MKRINLIISLLTLITLFLTNCSQSGVVVENSTDDFKHDIPSNPIPKDTEINQKLHPTLQWTFSELELIDPVFTLYLGETEEKLEIIAKDISQCFYTLKNLSPSTDYFWQIVAKSTESQQRVLKKSPVWQFRTREPETYNLTFTCSPTDVGQIRLNHAEWKQEITEKFIEGEEFLIETEPKEGFHFHNWTFDDFSTSSTNITLKAENDGTFTAHFFQESTFLSQPILNTQYEYLNPSIQISWNKTNGANGYKLLKNELNLATLTSDIQTFTDTNLEVNSTYTYTLQSFSSITESTWSSPVTIFTLNQSPEIPELIIPKDLVMIATPVCFEWSISSDRENDHVSYNIQIVDSKKQQSVFTETTEATGIEIASVLKADQTYNIQIIAKDHYQNHSEPLIKSFSVKSTNPFLKLSHSANNSLTVSAGNLKNIAAGSVELLFDNNKLTIGEAEFIGTAKGAQELYYEMTEFGLVIDFGFISGYKDLDDEILVFDITELIEVCSITVDKTKFLDRMGTNIAVEKFGTIIKFEEEKK